MFKVGRPVRPAQAAIKAELPTQTAVASPPIDLIASTATSESLPPPIGTKVRLGRFNAPTAAATPPRGKTMRPRRSSPLR
ncbi:hypothetical protein RLIN73S_05318 [Rhodanobacter lindaniclasticus]